MKASRLGKRKSWLSVLIITVMLFGLYPGTGPAEAESGVVAKQGSGTTYYIDSTEGSDNNTGTAENRAWKTLSKVNQTEFQPGDRILLKAGEVWSNQTLAPKGSGIEGSPITIDQYGSGNKPKIQTNGQAPDAVTLSNQQYFEIHNLDVSNRVPVTGSFAESLGDFRGIHVTGFDAGTLNYIRISNVDVHDVSGEIAWISGKIPEIPDPGIRFNTGWDGSKKTGGIVFDTTVADTKNPVRPTVFNDVIIENSTIKNTSFGGIIIKQYTGDGGGNNSSGIVKTGWGKRENETDPIFTPHTNIIIRGNYITQKDTDFGCNGIYVTGTRGGLVENNLVQGAGTVGIELNHADDIIVQYNEVFETTKKAGGADSSGIDPDNSTTKILIQYNYVHDNGDGILVCQFSFGSTTIRYNVLENNKKYPLYLHSDKRAVAEIYNNTIYNEVSNYMIVANGKYLDSTYNIRNNILYTTKEVRDLPESPTLNYDSNSYYSTVGTLTPPSSDVNALTSNPQLVNPGKGVSGSEEDGPALDSVSRYQLKPESKLINRGADILGNNELNVKDFAGKNLYNGIADLGAFEYYDASSTTANIAGRITNSAGSGMSGVALTDLVGSNLQAVTDSSGYYFIKDAAVGSGVNLKAVKNGYSESETGVFTVEAGNVITRDLRMKSNAATGSITGKVLDGSLATAAGVTLTLSLDGAAPQTVTSDMNGNYSFPAVEIGEDYTISATKEGYRTAVVSGIKVDPAHTTEMSDLYVISKQAVLFTASDFNELEVDALPAAPWTVTSNGGSIGAAELPSATDKSIRLTRSSSNGSTSMSQTFAQGALKGVVTLTADVLKLDNAGSSNWFSLPYIYSSEGTASKNIGVSVAFNNGQIVAYKGGSSTNLMPYETNKWYNLRLVMNTGSGKFDLYVNDVLVVDQADFRNKISDIGRIEYYATSSHRGTVYINNVQIYQGIPYERNDAGITDVTADLGPLAKKGENYSLDVPHFMNSVQLTATVSSPNISSLTIKGLAAVSGQPAEKIMLDEGENTIAVVVVAEDGVTTQTVNVIIDRAPATTDSTLQKLQVTGNGGEEIQLSPSFSYDSDSYTLTVSESVYGLIVTPLAGSPDTEVRVNGKVVGSSGTSEEILLKDSVSEITVSTVSADGTDYRTYIITVNWEGTYIPTQPEIKDSTVSPLSVVFDKNPANQQAVAVEVEWNGNTLYSIRNGETELIEADYNVTGNVYGIEASYLLQQPLGTLSLVFDFNQGKDATVDIQIIDTTDGGAHPSPSPSVSPTPSESPSPSVSPTPSESPSPSVSPTPSESPSPSVSPTPSESPSPSVSPTPSESPSPSVSPTPSESPSPSASPTPSESPSPSVSPTPSESPSPSVSPTPSESPSPSVSPTPSADPVSGTGNNTPTPPAVTVSSGTLIVQPQTVTGSATSQMTITENALNEALALAAADGNNGKRVTVIVAPTDGAKTYEISLPLAALSDAAKGQILEIQTNLAKIVLPGGMLSEEHAAQANSIVLKISEADLAAQSSVITTANGGREAVDISLIISGKELNWQNSAALVQVSIPYKLSTSEWLNSEFLSVWHIDENGLSHPVYDGKYKSGTEALTFTVSHFGTYVVVMNRQTFADLGALHWASKPVEVLASKGIINGVSEGYFAPAAQISRADYAIMLIHALGLESSTAGSSRFTDVLPGSYYYEAVNIAQSLGIVSGNSDGSFTPIAPITRQEMIVMTDRALVLAGVIKSSGSGSVSGGGILAAGFRDLDDVANYAKEAVHRMLGAQWIQGNNGMIHPDAPASRGEAAVLLYNIYSQL